MYRKTFSPFHNDYKACVDRTVADYFTETEREYSGDHGEDCYKCFSHQCALDPTGSGCHLHDMKLKKATTCEEIGDLS